MHVCSPFKIAFYHLGAMVHIETNCYNQGLRSNQCHRAMARVDFLPRPESQYIYWAPRKKDPIESPPELVLTEVEF